MKGFVNKCLYKFYRMFIFPQRLKKNKLNVYLIGTPEYGNLGDQMIAKAQLQFLTNLGISCFEVPESMYEKFRNTVVDDENNLFILQGGGNFGNEYLSAQIMRRDIITNYPKSKIVMMPQTIFYKNTDEGKKELEIDIDIFSKHTNLHLFAREKVSYDKMKECFPKNNVELVPDIVLSGDIASTDKVKKKRQVLFLIRDDREKIDNSKNIEDIKLWCKNNGYNIKISDTYKYYKMNILNRNKELAKIFNLIQQSEFVVTDRLHGMIFSYINNTPAIVFPNYNHKIISSYEWIKDGKVKLYDKDLNLDMFVEEMAKRTNKRLTDEFAPLKAELLKDKNAI